jgi:hypothetical protein
VDSCESAYLRICGFWALGVLLYVTAPALWHSIRHRLTNSGQKNFKTSHRLPGETSKTARGDPNNERR